MTQVDKLREKLVNKLADLFQLNQPDLDFGFYRIMHAKAAEVQQFIDQDLLSIITNAFGQANDNQVTEAKARYESAIQQAKDYGVPNPEETKPVQEAKAAYDAARESGSNEAQVYDHLYRFFERYYDKGDFVSRRYYTRETAERSAPYAIPYNGEEVKLHWANADQYYIKSADYFSNYSFDLRQAKEVKAQDGLDFGSNDTPLRVHFQIVDASEGEHGNIKATDNQKREFILHNATPVELNEANELVVNFEYRTLSNSDMLSKEQEDSIKKAFGATRKGDLLNLYITSQIFESAKKLVGLPEDYIQLLSAPAPTDSIKQRPLLAKYISQYTDRNTMDYFIHKDLGSFLRRELDFYIKNEVMRLDDIENADVPAVESYLSKIKVLRQISHKLIDFLAQLENFQKKLWLKKKLVTETNYCITLDRVPEALYPEIANNDAQLTEWVQLFAIDEIKGDTSTPTFSKPLTVGFLQANKSLVLDTQFFGESFKAELLASIDDFDEQCDGLLIHAENFQALNFLNKRYRKKIESIYIDPPYNTSASEIIYKNSYKSSSWLSFMENRLQLGKSYLTDTGMQCTTIDDFEFHKLREVLANIFGEENIAGVVSIKNNPSGRSTVKGFSIAHEYGIFTFSSEKSAIGMIPRTKDQLSQYGEVDDEGQFQWRSFLRSGGANDVRSARPKLHYPLIVNENKIRIPQMKWDTALKEWVITEKLLPNDEVFYPTNNDIEYTWRLGVDTLKSRFDDLQTRISKQGKRAFDIKFYLDVEGVLPKTVWDEKTVNATAYGTTLLRNIMGSSQSFSFPKSLFAVQQSLRVIGANNEDVTVLDYFPGSGTTGHAVINLNRKDDGKRKYILTEMGNHFDTVLKPRLAKVAYASDWKNGRPVARDTGISHCFKYIRLESYEDTLNNLRLASDPIRQRALNANEQLKQDYMLNYMLNVETRGSQSLLNIDAFTDPTAYTLDVKKPGSDESVERNIDLIETFNYLIGLRVEHTAAPQCFNANFKRIDDSQAPEEQTTRLVLDGRLQQDDKGPWWLRKVEGWVPSDSANPNNGQQDKILIIWRKLTGDLEQDNLVLDEWFKAHRINSRDFEYNTIYVNGSNNLPNLKLEEDRWKVRLIEEEFMQRMWDVEG